MSRFGNRLALTAVGFFLATFGNGLTQLEPAPFRWEEHALHSGFHFCSGDEPEIVFSEILRAEGAGWLQVHFGESELGGQSFIEIVSLTDGASERLDAEGMSWRRDRSAFFNGEAVRLTLHVAPGDAGVFFRVEGLRAGAPGGSGDRDICYDEDQRISYFDDAVGRMWPAGATAYIGPHGPMLTAGHACDEPAVLDVVEFNVPDSNPDGGVNHPPPEDQYPIDVGSVVFFWEGEGEKGNDWCVFRCNPNPSTGLLPVQAQEKFYRLSADFLPDHVRITGYGIDETPPGSGGGENADTRTLQSDAGYLTDEVFESPNDVYLVYFADTEGGNSGSPVINFDLPAVSLGIHTTGGCIPPDYGNEGTSFSNILLSETLHQYIGPNAIYVDVAHPAPLETGHILRPFSTVGLGFYTVQTGGILSIAAGSYDEALTINRAVTIQTPV